MNYATVIQPVALKLHNNKHYLLIHFRIIGFSAPFLPSLVYNLLERTFIKYNGFENVSYFLLTIRRIIYSEIKLILGSIFSISKEKKKTSGPFLNQCCQFHFEITPREKFRLGYYRFRHSVSVCTPNFGDTAIKKSHHTHHNIKSGWAVFDEIMLLP